MHPPCIRHLGADGGAGDVATALMSLRASSLAGVVSNRSYGHHIIGTLPILFSFACVNQCIHVHLWIGLIQMQNVSTYVYSCIYVYLYLCMYIFV